MGVVFITSYPAISIALALVWLTGTFFGIIFNKSKEFFRNLLISSVIMKAIINVFNDKNIIFKFIDNSIKVVAQKTYLTKYYGANSDSILGVVSFDYIFITGILLTLAEIALLYVISKINIKDILLKKKNIFKYEKQEKSQRDNTTESISNCSDNSIDNITLGVLDKKNN